MLDVFSSELLNFQKKYLFRCLITSSWKNNELSVISFQSRWIFFKDLKVFFVLSRDYIRTSFGWKWKFDTKYQYSIKIIRLNRNNSQKNYPIVNKNLQASSFSCESTCWCLTTLIFSSFVRERKTSESEEIRKRKFFAILWASFNVLLLQNSVAFKSSSNGRGKSP